MRKECLRYFPNVNASYNLRENLIGRIAYYYSVGEASSNFSGYIPHVYNWGVSLSRPTYKLRLNWNYRDRQREDFGSLWTFGLKGTF